MTPRCATCAPALGIAREVLRGDRTRRFAVRQNQQPLNHVSQLAYVTGPLARLQHGYGILAERARLKPGRIRHALDEIVHQIRNILPTPIQRRHVNRDHVEAIVQILAEPACLNL